jgi:hypothetical protein
VYHDIKSWTARIFPCVVLVLTMGLHSTGHSTSRSSSIFEDGTLKPGIYKIQNLYSQTYLDIHEHSKEVCCRPAKDLERRKGLVRPHLFSVDRASDNQKWEIKSFGTGYVVQRVSVLILPIGPLFITC